MKKIMMAIASVGMAVGSATAADQACQETKAPEFDYRVLATSKTSTMERELNGAAAAGYRFSKAMGGKSANGGQEVIVAMVKDPAISGHGVRQYRLLATTKTSTMQKECSSWRTRAIRTWTRPSLNLRLEAKRWSSSWNSIP